MKNGCECSDLCSWFVTWNNPSSSRCEHPCCTATCSWGHGTNRHMATELLWLFSVDGVLYLHPVQELFPLHVGEIIENPPSLRKGSGSQDPREYILEINPLLPLLKLEINPVGVAWVSTGVIYRTRRNFRGGLIFVLFAGEVDPRKLMRTKIKNYGPSP